MDLDGTSIVVAVMGLVGGIVATWASRRGKAKDEQNAASAQVWQAQRDLFEEVRSERNELRSQLLATAQRHQEAIEDLERRHHDCVLREGQLNERLTELQKLVVGQITLAATQTELMIDGGADEEPDDSDEEAAFIKRFLATLRMIGEP